MALITMAVYDTEANDRTKFTKATLEGLVKTVNLFKHRVVVVDNASCQATKDLLEKYKDVFTIITLPENVGTAKGINYAWRMREKEEYVVKCDNDVIIHDTMWVDKMEDAMRREPKIGILGLKRKDLEESPDNPNMWYRSRITFLPKEKHEDWVAFEETQHCMGTCQMYSPQLLEKIGYLVQPSIYGFDDSLASFRARVGGFKVGFLLGISIDHIDTGENLYQKEKERIASDDFAKYNEMIKGYKEGTLSIYHED
jgi:GT2 family glycosyltransferase